MKNYPSFLSFACGLVFLALSAVGAKANAADAVAGKAAWENYCASCHGQSYAAYGKNASRIRNAISTNKGGMGTPTLRALSNTLTIEDIAAYANNPSAANTAPAISLSVSSLTFQNTTVNSNSTQNVRVNNTGTASLSLSAISSSNANFVVDSSSTCQVGTNIAAGGNCNIAVKFTPTQAVSSTGILSLSHNASGGSSTVALSGTGTAVATPTLSVSATNVSFGDTALNQRSNAQTVTLSNTGAAALQLSGLSLSGGDVSQFSIDSSSTCSSTSRLNPSGSCTVVLSFTPSGIGARSTSLVMASNASNTNITISGTGVNAPAPIVSWPSILDLGTVQVNVNSATRHFALKNTGNAALSISSLTASPAVVTVNTSACGTSLGAGQSCDIALTMRATQAGAQNVVLQLSSNAAAASLNVRATAIAQPIASMAWDANNSLDAKRVVSFANTPANQESPLITLSLSNKGSGTATLQTFQLSGPQADQFSLVGDVGIVSAAQSSTPAANLCKIGLALAPAASCTVQVQMQPSVVGLVQAELVAQFDNATWPDTLTLSGQGLEAIHASQNAGARGGCSLAAPGQATDPVLWLSVLLAAAILLRRKIKSQHLTSKVAP